MPPAGGIEAQNAICGASDADTELAGLLLAGVRVKVVGRALLEAVTAAQLGAQKNPNCGYGHSYRKPRDDAKCGKSGFFHCGCFFIEELSFGIVEHEK